MSKIIPSLIFIAFAVIEFLDDLEEQPCCMVYISCEAGGHDG